MSDVLVATEKAGKKCKNAACSTHNIPIDTELENCIACGQPLALVAEELFVNLFSDDLLSPFGWPKKQ